MGEGNAAAEAAFDELSSLRVAWDSYLQQPAIDRDVRLGH
jgi:hypothetical protein